MTIHRPGLPEDLPPPELLWAWWAVVAVLEASTEEEDLGIHRTGHWVDDRGGLHLDDCGCTWWTFVRAGEGRFVLYGEDEASDVKWHEPTVDMLAGGPEWLPYEKLRDLVQGYELGCVYWYENGAWARAPYPATLRDDGLDCGMSRFAGRDAVRELLEDDVPEEFFDRAEQYRLTPELLESLVADSDSDHWDLPAMKRALTWSVLSAGSLPPAGSPAAPPPLATAG